MIVQRFVFIRDEKKLYAARGAKKSRDRLMFKHQRPAHSSKKIKEIEQCIKQAQRTGNIVRVLLFGYFQSDQMSGEVIHYDEEMRILQLRIDDRMEWIDLQDIIDIDSGE